MQPALTPQQAEPEVQEAKFVAHLDELRKRIIFALAAVFAGAVVCYSFSDGLLHFMMGPIRPETDRLFFFSPHGAFLVKLKIALFSGFIAASPVVASQIWAFISPGLLTREKRLLLPLTLVTTFLFLTGSVFSFKAVLPVALHFLLGFQTPHLAPMISVSEYLGFLFSMILGFGVAFNLPVFISFFVYVGVLNTSKLRSYRPHAFVLIFITAAILTPPDILSQFFLAVPLLLLYELSILSAWFIQRIRKPSQK